MASSFREVERDYVVNKLLVSPSKMIQRLSPSRKRSGYKQFMEEQKKILATKYPFLIAAQIQKRASAMWVQLSRKERCSYARDVPKITRPASGGRLDTLQSWLSSVRIETQPLPSTPQTTGKLPIYMRRPPTPKVPRTSFNFDEDDSEELDEKSARPEPNKENTPPQKMGGSATASPTWIHTNNVSPQFKVPTSTKKYTEGSMRTAFSSSQTPPTVVENNKVIKARGILLSRENPKSKTFRVSFSDITSILTFEKTPFEKEMVQPEIEPGYTLRSQPALIDSYSLRTRTVPESPNLIRSPRSPLTSPLVSLPLRSPRRNRKKEEEEIRQLEIQLSSGKNRKWIPLLPTTPPILVKLKGSTSQSQSSDRSEPESPYPSGTKEEFEQSFQVHPPTPNAGLHLEQQSAIKHLAPMEICDENRRNQQRESLIEKQSPARDGTKEKNIASNAKLNDDDLHLQLSPSGSEDSSLPDLAGYDKSGRVQLKERSGENGTETSKKGDEIVCRNKHIAQHFQGSSRTDKDEGMDHYSTASEDSQNNEVYYDASGYESDDSDMERERQLSFLYSNKKATRYSKGVDCEEAAQCELNTDTVNLDKKEICRETNEKLKTDLSNKPSKQKCITHYFERRSKKSSVGFDLSSPTNKPSVNNNTINAPISDNNMNKMKDSPESLRKVSVSVNTGGSSDPGTPRTPRTPRRLTFRNQTNPVTDAKPESSDRDFFHTPQNRMRIPRNTRQTPSKTAPALMQRRRSSRLLAKNSSAQIKAVSDSKTMNHAKSTDMGKTPSVDNTVSSRGRRPKKKLNMNGTVDKVIGNKSLERKKTKNEETDIVKVYSPGNNDNHNLDDDCISPVKFYGKKAQAAKGKRRGIQYSVSSLSDIPNKSVTATDGVHDGTEENIETNGKFSAVTTKLKKSGSTNTKKQNAGKTARISLCNIKTGTVDINVHRKRGAKKMQVRSTSSKRFEDDWKLFDTDIYVKKPRLSILDPLDDFFENNSSPDNDANTMKNEGLETVQRTVQSMREAAMNGSFTSPFCSSTKLSKLLCNHSNENSCHATDFSDVSSQRSFDETEKEAKESTVDDQQPDVSHQHQVFAKRASTIDVQTFLSDMFAELTPPDRPKRTNRRLCISGRGKEEDNFNSMFDNPAEDNIFM